MEEIMGKYYYCSEDSYDEDQISAEQPPENIWQKTSSFLRPSNLVEWSFLIFFLTSLFSPLLLRLFDSGGVGWLFELKGPFSIEPLGEIAAVLAPLLALALAIERLVETIFSYFEGTIENIVKNSSLSLVEFKKLQKKLSAAWKDVNDVKLISSSETSEVRTQVLNELTIAEQQVTQVSQFLLEIPKDPKYLAYKKRMAILISFSLGYIVAIWTDQGIFEYLHVGVPRIIDILITGAVLGAGAEPMHSLIGALDGLKGALKSFSLPAAAK